MPSINRKYGRAGPKYPVPESDHLILAVDLGKRKVGVALGTPTELLACDTVHGDGTPEDMAAAVRQWAQPLLWEIRAAYPAGDVWVCEWPLKYDKRRRSHANIDELHAVGYLLGPWDEKYTPGEWKGNVPKAAHRKRIRRALTEKEQELLPSEDAHDTWDAVGILLFATGRTKRGGVQ